MLFPSILGWLELASGDSSHHFNSSAQLQAPTLLLWAKLSRSQAKPSSSNTTANCETIEQLSSHFSSAICLFVAYTKAK